jgi:hypothetical protein
MRPFTAKLAAAPGSRRGVQASVQRRWRDRRNQPAIRDGSRKSIPDRCQSCRAGRSRCRRMKARIGYDDRRHSREESRLVDDEDQAASAVTCPQPLAMAGASGAKPAGFSGLRCSRRSSTEVLSAGCAAALGDDRDAALPFAAGCDPTIFDEPGSPTASPIRFVSRTKRRPLWFPRVRANLRPNHAQCMLADSVIERRLGPNDLPVE